MQLNFLKEICANCGFTFGAHHAGRAPYPYNYCPGQEKGMDWKNGPGTSFRSTGTYKKDTDEEEKS